MASDSQALTVGNVSVGGSVYKPWPTTWQYPVIYNWPYAPGWYAPEQDYANEVEIERGEHDAVVRFYRKREKSRMLVKELTVPLGVLDWLGGKE